MEKIKNLYQVVTEVEYLKKRYLTAQISCVFCSQAKAEQSCQHLRRHFPEARVAKVAMG